MKCSDINRILDEHSWSSLSAAERSELNAHLVECAACVESVTAYELLRDEPVARPVPGLLHSIVARLPSETPRRSEHRWPFGWQTVGGLAAMGAVVLVAVFSVVGQQTPEPLAPTDTAAPGLVADTIDDTSGQTLPPRQVGLPQAPVFVEGEHFVALPAVFQGVEALDRVTAWIFYMWSCLHCYEFEAALSEWIARQDPNEVDVVRVPVQWNPVVTLHARAHYAAELLGISDRVREAFFESIHERGEVPASREEIAILFSRLGVDRASFDNAFDSGRVTAELEQGRSIATAFGIDSTPTIVVDGRYMTSPGLAGSHQSATEVLDLLIARASAARGLLSDAGPSPACDSARIVSLREVLDAIESERASVLENELDDCGSDPPLRLFR